MVISSHFRKKIHFIIFFLPSLFIQPLLAIFLKTIRYYCFFTAYGILLAQSLPLIYFPYKRNGYNELFDKLARAGQKLRLSFDSFYLLILSYKPLPVLTTILPFALAVLGFFCTKFVTTRKRRR